MSSIGEIQQKFPYIPYIQGFISSYWKGKLSGVVFVTFISFIDSVLVNFLFVLLPWSTVRSVIKNGLLGLRLIVFSIQAIQDRSEPEKMLNLLKQFSESKLA